MSLKRLYLILPVLVFFSCSKFNTLQKSSNLEEKLKGAIEYYNAKDYYRAGTLLEEITPLVRGRAEAEQAMFYLANTYFQKKEYLMANYYYREFYSTYPRSQYAEEAMYMHGKSLYMDTPQYNLDQTSAYSAMKVLQEYANRFASGKYLDEVHKMMDALDEKILTKTYENTKIYHKTGQYKAAVVALQNFMESYPDSKYQEEISYLQLDAQFELAKHSVEKKQEERYMDAVTYYYKFVDRYRGGKYMKQAEAIFVQINNHLAGIQKQKKNRHLN